MSDVGLSMSGASGQGSGASRPPKRKKKHSAIAVLVALAVVLGLVGVVGYGGYRVYLKFQTLAPAEDYPGPGSGKVVVQIKQGENLSEVGKTLVSADVVASVQAFSEAATANPDATSITPGSYEMLKQMSAAGAVERLLDPAARNEVTILIQEGLRTDQIVAELSSASGKPESEFYEVIRSPSKLPLPKWAKGKGDARAEGFLFPATYTFEKGDTPQSMLKAMVARFDEVAKETKFVDRSKEMDQKPYDVLIIASLVQAEGVGDDYEVIAGAIYNRLNPKFWSTLGTNGRLDIDATLNYALKKSELNFTDQEKRSRSPYNTYIVAGLPPTPINSPGEKAIRAALKPKESKYLWWAHGPEGQTCMANTLRQHENNVNGECSWK